MMLSRSIHPDDIVRQLPADSLILIVGIPLGDEVGWHGRVKKRNPLINSVSDSQSPMSMPVLAPKISIS